MSKQSKVPLMSDTKLRETRMDPEGRAYPTPEEREMRRRRRELIGFAVSIAVSIPTAVLVALLTNWLLRLL